MTKNKRRKADARNLMESTGINYTRAVREMTSTELKDRVNLTWSPGATEAGREIKMDSRRHFMLTGKSFTEPERMLRSMVDQLDRSNHDDDVKFWIIHPGHAFQDISLGGKVSRLIQSDGTQLEHEAENVMKKLYDLGKSRLTLMWNHPERPSSIEEARNIALRESAESGVDPKSHKLFFPYIYLIAPDLDHLSRSYNYEGSFESHAIARMIDELVTARGVGITICVSMLQHSIHAFASNTYANLDKIVMSSSEMSSHLITGTRSNASKLGRREALLFHGPKLQERFIRREYENHNSIVIAEGEMDVIRLAPVVRAVSLPRRPLWLDRLEEVANNSEKWGGDSGIKNPEPECVASTRSLLGYADTLEVEIPAIFANEDGGVTVEWGSLEHVITIEVAKYGNYNLFALDVESKEAIDIDTTEVDQVREFISKHAPRKSGASA